MITEFDKTRNKVIRRWVNVSPGRADEIADLVVEETAALRRQLAELHRQIAELESKLGWRSSKLDVVESQLAELRQALEFGPGRMDGPAFLEYIACKLEGDKPFNSVLAARDLRLKAKQARAALDRIGGGEEEA